MSERDGTRTPPQYPSPDEEENNEENDEESGYYTPVELWTERGTESDSIDSVEVINPEEYDNAEHQETTENLPKVALNEGENQPDSDRQQQSKQEKIAREKKGRQQAEFLRLKHVCTYMIICMFFSIIVLQFLRAGISDIPPESVRNQPHNESTDSSEYQRPLMRFVQETENPADDDGDLFSSDMTLVMPTRSLLIPRSDYMDNCIILKSDFLEISTVVNTEHSDILYGVRPYGLFVLDTSRPFPFIVTKDTRNVCNSPEHDVSTEGLPPGGVTADCQQLSATCNLDNWLMAVFTQVLHNPRFRRRIIQLAEHLQEPFQDIYEAFLFWEKGWYSLAKCHLVPDRNMLSSEPERIFNIIRSQQSHRSDRNITRENIALSQYNFDGSPIRDIQEGLTEYEASFPGLRFVRPNVFLSLNMNLLPGVTEDVINPVVRFAGERYYLMAVTYSYDGHLTSRVFRPNGDLTPDGQWMYYDNTGQGRLVPFTNPPQGSAISMLHYVRI